MSPHILSGICILLLLSYVFDLTAQKTRIPSVLLLLIVGWAIKQLLIFLDLGFPDLEPILPLLGTAGLVLIVLEGSLELKWNKENRPVFIEALISAILQLLLVTSGLAFFFTWYFGIGFHQALINVLPLTVISSAIVIPSSRDLPGKRPAFLTIESTISDVAGILLFNILAENDSFKMGLVFSTFRDLAVTVLISLAAVWILVILMDRIRHHVKFLPIILTLMLFYTVTKEWHLPSLTLVLLFGLLLSNIHILSPLQKYLSFSNEVVSAEVPGFKRITGELTFLVRSLFFLSFGSSININEFLNESNLVLAAIIIISGTIIRAGVLWLFPGSYLRLWPFAPKGLITILLFMSIPDELKIGAISKPLVVLVVIGSILMMFFRSDGKMPRPEEEGVASREEEGMATDTHTG
ncbi:MAG: sodium:proton antiporter [Cyclobacteriaceae bacterium]